MAKSFIEFNPSTPGITTSLSTYDSSKLNLGSSFVNYTGNNNPEENGFGPFKLGIARPIESSTIPCMYPYVLEDGNLQYIFLADNATAAATRRIILYTYNKTTHNYSYSGFVTLTFPSTTAHTVRGLRVSRENYIDGTVSVSGTSVTGTDTSWLDSRLTVGSRIGFGSPVTQWYQIASITSNTSLTLTTSAPELTDTSYVIEDLRIVVATTNATAANGGLFLAKGLRIENFNDSGTTIPAATTIDNIRAVYWLADAATVVNTTSAGVAIEPITSWTEQYVYVLNVTGSRIYKYNIRAGLTLTSGKTTSALTLITGNRTLTGTLSQANNGRIVTTNHGPGSGVPSLYFVTTTRVYRTSLDSITSGGIDWTSDIMTEVPPGGVSTYAATGALSAIEYAGDIDRFLLTSTGAAGVRSYITRFYTDNSPLDHIFLVDGKQLDQSSADSDSPVHPSINASTFSAWSESGILHLCRNGATTALNQMYSIPISAHWRYSDSTNQYVITPTFNTTDAVKFYRMYVNSIKYAGSDTFSIPTEPYRTYYRTSGISDNTGSWTLVPRNGNITSISPSSEIQFKFEFKTIGSFCIPSRIMNFVLTYEDNRSDSHYEASLVKSDISSNTFAWLQVDPWGENIPNLNIKIYNSITKSLVLQDNILNSIYGTWEYSNDGSTWSSWDSSEDQVGNYIRYSANTLPSGIKVTAIIGL